jgi:predicted O-linked N-acetylglucosamine transferase (SPINDLY family)
MLRRLLSPWRRPAGDPLDALLREAAALRERGRLPEAEAAMRRALALAPDAARVHIQLGVTIASLGRIDEAERLFASAVELDPGDAYARMNLANAYRRRGQLDQALAHYRAAVRLQPDLITAWSNMLRPALDACDWAEASRALEVVLARRDRGDPDWPRYLAPMDSLLAPLPPRACREVAEYHGRLLAAAPAVPVASSGRRGDGRLRLGYFSRDFRNHAVGQLVRTLFRLHDRSRFEILAYSYGRDDASRYREEIVATADRFADVRAESPAETARRIAADAVDILIDLGGYTTDHRLGVLAARPAPIQVHYLGYPATLGARFVDYFVTDHLASPPGQDALFTEHLVRLPDCFMVSDPDQPLADAAPSRAACGLPEAGAVLCAFHQAAKITPEVLAAWAEILRAVPDSVLWLRSAGPELARNLAAAARQHGVAPERLRYAPNVADKRDHVARMAAADLFLDTFGRYNGHSTVNEALWAALPPVTVAGETFAARVAASLVTAAGAPELAESAPAGYVARAIALARDPAARERLRRRLTDARPTAPLFDNTRTVRALERAYEAMWALHAAGRPPQALSVPAA